MRIKYTKELLENVCKNSYSYRQCLSMLGLKEAGGNYSCLKKRIQEYNIDISHFKHQAWNKGKTNESRKRPTIDYLSNKQSIQSWKLKKRLLKEKLFDHKCYKCNQSTWLNNPIPIELHHINGNSCDNSLDNLTLLCPNCHALTSNCRAKNKNQMASVGLEPTRE